MKRSHLLLDPMRLVDPELNYGRASVCRLASQIPSVRVGVDLGAGSGQDLSNLQSAFPTGEFHAVESFPFFQKQLLSKGFDVHDLDLERDSLPFADESLDLVLTNQTMEHLKEIFWVLHEVSRVLSVGGYLIIGVPNLASLHNRLLLLMGQQPTAIRNNSAHLRGYTGPDLVRLLDSGHPGGYELKASEGANFYPFPPPIARRLAQMFPQMAWGLFMLFQKCRPYEQGFLDYPVNSWLETNFYLGPNTAKIWARLKPTGYGGS